MNHGEVGVLCRHKPVKYMLVKILPINSIALRIEPSHNIFMLKLFIYSYIQSGVVPLNLYIEIPQELRAEQGTM